MSPNIPGAEYGIVASYYLKANKTNQFKIKITLFLEIVLTSFLFRTDRDANRLQLDAVI